MKSKSLEDALAELEAKKAQTAEYLAKHAPEIEAATAKRNALNAKLAALSQEERRQVLDAAGLKHVSAAPEPITPLRGSSYRPPNKPPEMVAMAEQKNKLSEEERKRTKELDAMRVPGDGGQTFSSRWLPSESQQQTPEPPAPPVVAAGASGGVEPVTGKRWTPEKIAELKSYREKHGTKKAAEFFGISAQLIRKMLPSEKPQPKGYSAFTYRTK